MARHVDEPRRDHLTFLAFDFNFLGGSMGEATGERIASAFAHATEQRQPLISFVACRCSGLRRRARPTARAVFHK